MRKNLEDEVYKLNYILYNYNIDILQKLIMFELQDEFGCKFNKEDFALLRLYLTTYRMRILKMLLKHNIVTINEKEERDPRLFSLEDKDFTFEDFD